MIDVPRDKMVRVETTADFGEAMATVAVALANPKLITDIFQTSIKANNMDPQAAAAFVMEKSKALLLNIANGDEPFTERIASGLVSTLVAWALLRSVRSVEKREGADEEEA